MKYFLGFNFFDSYFTKFSSLEVETSHFQIIEVVLFKIRNPDSGGIKLDCLAYMERMSYSGKF